MQPQYVKDYYTWHTSAVNWGLKSSIISSYYKNNT
jgi:hypothetical protein